MFADACRKAMQYTKPLILSHAQFSGSPTAGNGTLVVVNDEGWFLTAAHLFSPFVKANQDAAAVKAHFDERARVENDKTLDAKQKRKQLNKLNPKNDWIVSTSYWWCPGANVEPKPLQFTKLIVAPEHDLVLGQFAGFDKGCVPEYPIFKAASLDPGTSLCRLGFPFTSIKLDLNHQTRTVAIDVQGLSFFPIEGIFTRVLSLGRDPKGQEILVIETSSPGLRGQSGGPIFDRAGIVWGIQSQTSHHSLGFDPPDPTNRQRTVHQFLNVGMGVHPATIAGLMKANGVKFREEGQT